MVARPVLIVDDDIDHAVILRTVLASVAPDAQTDTCTDPRRLPDALLEAAPEAVVFMDRMLGGVESLGYLAQLREERSDLVVIVLSSALSEDDRERARRAGATEALEKPGTLAEWRSMLARVMADATRDSDSERPARAG